MTFIIEKDQKYSYSIKAFAHNLPLNHLCSGDLDLEQVILAKCKENPI